MPLEHPTGSLRSQLFGWTGIHLVDRPIDVGPVRPQSSWQAVLSRYQGARPPHEVHAVSSPNGREPGQLVVRIRKDHQELAGKSGLYLDIFPHDYR